MKKIILAVLILMMLTACGSNAVPPIALTPNPSAPADDTYVTTSCATIYPTLPENIKFDGFAIMDDYKFTSHLFMKDLENGKEIEMATPEDTVSDIRISPDHKIAAYQLGNPKTNEWSINIIDGTGKRKIETIWKQGFFILGNWLNNDEVLLFTNPPFVAFNPYTNQQKNFDYPDFPGYMTETKSNRVVMFDPSLERVVYKNTNDKVSLYDIPNKKVLAEVDNHGAPSLIATWAPDGSQAAVVGTILLSTKADDRSEDLFGMARDGTVKRLTRLANHYGKLVSFSKAGLSWSPDSRYVAFWIATVQNGYKYWELAIADTTTQKTTAYCIANDYENVHNSTHYLPSPAWSPDGKQLLVENRYDKTSSRVLILDLASKNAYQIEENKYPVGWITKP